MFCGCSKRLDQSANSSFGWGKDVIGQWLYYSLAWSKYVLWSDWLCWACVDCITWNKTIAMHCVTSTWHVTVMSHNIHPWPIIKSSPNFHPPTLYSQLSHRPLELVPPILSFHGRVGHSVCHRKFFCLLFLVGQAGQSSSLKINCLCCHSMTVFSSAFLISHHWKVMLCLGSACQHHYHCWQN